MKGENLLDPLILKKMKSLQILARQVVEGFCSGLHRSPHKGFSIEFREHRSYVPGDEIRYVDWKVFGKRDRFYIREYEEETNLRATLLVDMSGSMAYGKFGIKKYQYAQQLAACLAYLLIQQTDSAGLLLFDTRPRTYIPPRSSISHLHILLETLVSHEPGGETSLGKVFHEIVPKLHRRGLLIIISDCFDDLGDLLTGIAHLRHAHHEVMIFQLWDRVEIEFPFDRWTLFKSLEDQQKILVEPSQIRQRYLYQLDQFRRELKKGCHQHHVDLVEIITDQPYADVLMAYLNARRKY